MVDDSVDFILGAHIHTAGGLIQHHDIRQGEHPLAHQHLLLVAAGQVAHKLLHIRRADAELLPVVLGGLAFFILVDDTALADQFQARERDIVGDEIGQHQPVALAVFGDVGESMGDGFGRAAQFKGDAVLFHNTGDFGAVNLAEHGLAQFRAAGADQAGNAHHFPLADID